MKSVFIHSDRSGEEKKRKERKRILEVGRKKMKLELMNETFFFMKLKRYTMFYGVESVFLLVGEKTERSERNFVQRLKNFISNFSICYQKLWWSLSFWWICVDNRQSGLFVCMFVCLIVSLSDYQSTWMPACLIAVSLSVSQSGNLFAYSCLFVIKIIQKTTKQTYQSEIDWQTEKRYKKTGKQT